MMKTKKSRSGAFTITMPCNEIVVVEEGYVAAIVCVRNRDIVEAVAVAKKMIDAAKE